MNELCSSGEEHLCFFRGRGTGRGLADETGVYAYVFVRNSVRNDVSTRPYMKSKFIVNLLDTCDVHPPYMKIANQSAAYGLDFLDFHSKK